LGSFSLASYYNEGEEWEGVGWMFA
jgi:hypothetical protein